ncbi:MAG: dipeptidase PepE [Ferruginibacter sp.]
MSTTRLLAFSSSRVGDGSYLEAAVPLVKNFLGNEVTDIAFIPFASVTKDYEEYLANVNAAFASLPFQIKLVLPDNATEIISKAGAIMVGGGNSFKLLHDIYEYKLLDLIRNRVDAGIPYIGWSAGANIAGPTIGTTNDMPIIQPKSFNSLGLLPFQVNPHYFSRPVEGHNGKTRDQRLEEFLMVNSGVPIVGLPEGTVLHLENSVLLFTGPVPGIIFTSDKVTGLPHRREIAVGEDLSFLL